MPFKNLSIRLLTGKTAPPSPSALSIPKWTALTLSWTTDPAQDQEVTSRHYRCSKSVSFQRIVERLSRSDYRWLVSNRDRQDANPLIVRQHKCARAGRQIDHVSEQIRVSVS